MNSIIQMFNALPEFKQIYYYNGENHMMKCKKIPGDCFYCQVAKVFWGLDSGIYSQKLNKTRIINQI